MTDINEKLREARYFLEQMRAVEATDYSGSLEALNVGVDVIMEALQAQFGSQLRRIWRASGRPFGYTLSAFLSAARSVVFMMRRRFARVLGFKEWLDEAEGDASMRRLTDMRDTSIHRRPVRPVPDLVDVDVSDDLGEIKVVFRWVFDELPDKDVVSVCGEHLGHLERLVAECESLFDDRRAKPITKAAIRQGQH